ncbi:hypothetical protein HPB50_006955 [Hyalomma asiaticum]|uniref:Uncharacterized protein n=1 Tax=Hyalomma asiaticum TaxID=266040 RepID=A0ACB7T6B2_HYAAI|nr:hypothetical protein HPB50_006955 [Hyalomma asiaticum]
MITTVIFHYGSGASPYPQIGRQELAPLRVEAPSGVAPVFFIGLRRQCLEVSHCAFGDSRRSPSMALVKSPYSGSSIDDQIQCTSSDGRLCEIFKEHVSRFNEFFYPALHELVEQSAGELSLVERDAVPLHPRHTREHARAASALLPHLLARHRCLVSVDLREYMVTRDHRLVCNALRQSPSIRKLGLAKLATNECASRSFAAVLPHLDQLRELTQTVDLVSELLSRNDALTTFDLLSKESHWPAPDYADDSCVLSDDIVSCRIRPWIVALTENKTLTQLTLDLSWFNECECRCLFRAVASKECLRTVNVTAVRHEDVREILQALRDIGVEKRFHFSEDCSPRDPAVALTHSSPCITIDTSAFQDNDALVTPTDDGPSLDHVTSISVQMNHVQVNDGVQAERPQQEAGSAAQRESPGRRGQAAEGLPEAHAESGHEKAARDDKMLEKQRKRVVQVELVLEESNGVHSTLNPQYMGDGRGTLQPTRETKFTDMVSAGTSTTVSRRKDLGAVSKKVHLRKQNTDPGEFNKVRTLHNDGKKSIRSLTGLECDAEVVFVPRGSTKEPLLSPASRPWSTRHPVGRLASGEPDLGAHPDSGLGEDEPTTGSSMFGRPGFGSVGFRKSISGTLLSLPSCRIDDEEARSIALPCGSVVGTIGSAGSLAHRQSVLFWEDVEVVYYEEDEEKDGSGTPVVVVFLAAHGLAEYVDLFSREKVDLDALTLLGEEDLKTMGVPLGQRKKLLRAVEQRRVAFEDPGEVADSRL